MRISVSTLNADMVGYDARASHTVSTREIVTVS